MNCPEAKMVLLIMHHFVRVAPITRTQPAKSREITIRLHCTSHGAHSPPPRPKELCMHRSKMSLLANIPKVRTSRPGWDKISDSAIDIGPRVPALTSLVPSRASTSAKPLISAKKENRNNIRPRSRRIGYGQDWLAAMQAPRLIPHEQTGVLVQTMLFWSSRGMIYVRLVPRRVFRYGW